MKTKLLISFGVVALIIAWSVWQYRSHRYDQVAELPPLVNGTSTAYFAGGCFWCTESDFEKLTGVSETISGYAGGRTTDPTYEKVSSHTTGHIETVEVRYDPNIVTYQTLVEYFFSHVDPTDPNGQFVDQGDSYVSAAFYTSPEEKTKIEDELKRLEKSGAYSKPLVTRVIPFEKFYPAEEYHQDYSKKNPTRYQYYRGVRGRDQSLENICEKRLTQNVPCLTSKK